MAKIRQNALGKRRQIPIRRTAGIPVPRKGDKPSPQVISGRPELSDLEPISFENGDAPPPIPVPDAAQAVEVAEVPKAELPDGLVTVDDLPESAPVDDLPSIESTLPENSPSLRDSVVLSAVTSGPGKTKVELSETLKDVYPFTSYTSQSAVEREVYASLTRLRSSDQAVSTGPPRNRVWSPA